MDSHLDLKPFEYCFDPSPLQNSHISGNYFPFLKEALSGESQELKNSNCFDPRSLSLPWPTTFPATVQNKYWREAQAAAVELFEQITSAAQQKEYEVGYEKRMRDKNIAERGLLLIDAAASTSTNIFPAASVIKAKTMAKASLLFFIHDDDADSKIYGPGMNVLKESLEETQQLSRGLEEYRGPWKNTVFQQWVDECVGENYTMGLKMVRGMLTWAKYILDNPPKKHVHFLTWPDYVEYRINDSLGMAISDILQFTCGISMTESETRTINEMYRLYMMHFSLTNDLYSYEKENREAKEDGASFINGVQVLTDLLDVPSQTAKYILRLTILSLERQLNEAYITHAQSRTRSAKQLRFARSMIESAAGNLFLSSTLARYARAVPGSRLKN
ncbi:isoprenoid synthase domain-containing protein [Aspergillus avenaceus]|uniref:Isoprenoid synthase domain-containing protein n=1 Tax=Aspergillus avenaceus TaxID=36643 RepID=A0A5N6U2U1_ASPAV|nr:isoprenoid synthase domain-containing protein [Aspergillus avenaceus]